MPVLVLKTKLFMPTPRPDAILRKRLHERLDQGLERGRKLTLVAAPAGSGKTTLISEWVARQDQPTAWLSLDEGDNHPARWSAHVIAAIQSIEPSVGNELMALLEGATPPPLDAVIPALINEIASEAPSFILVLDDYQLIEDQAVHDAVTILLDHMPPEMHLVLITRADPPLPLSKLRVRDQVTELRSRDLRFTAAETAEFLNERMSLGLDPDHVAALEARTEGWIAGLQLAAVSLQGEVDAGSFIDSFAGSDRYVLDYLMEEVLARQPQEVQDFLQSTSILTRLSGPLCDATTGRGDGEAMLEQLDEDNLFIVPLDHRRGWYRYHQLFSDLLQHRLQSERPEALPELHLRASTWFEEHGPLAEAIDHALAADDWDRAAELIERIIDSLTEQEGDIHRLVAWYDRLPEEALRSRPSLNLFYAWLLADVARFDAATERLEAIEAQAGVAIPDLTCKAATIRAQMALAQGRIDDAVQQARTAVACLPQDAPSLWQDLAVNALVHGALLIGDLELADQALDRLPRLDSRLIALRLITNALAGFLLVMKGRYHEAAEQLRYTLDHAALDDTGRRLHPMAGLAQIGLGQIMLAWNQLDQAEELIQAGLRLGEQSHNSTTLSQGYRALLLLRYAQGDNAGHVEAIARMGEFERRLRSAGLWAAELVAAHRKQAQALAGQWDQVRPWLDTYRRRRPELPPRGPEIMAYADQLQELSFVRILLAMSRADSSHAPLAEAAASADRIIPAAEKSRHHNVLLNAWIYRSMVYKEQGDEPGARMALAQAVRLAAPAGILRHFLDEGPPMRELLRSLAEQPEAPAYADVLLEAFQPRNQEEPGHTLHPAGADREILVARANEQLVEPLTDRELDVLELMAQGMTNKEIADGLVVGVATVKTHAKNIFGKLDAGNRTEAAAKARELGLV